MNAPAMLTLCGSVAHVFQAPNGIDKKTGEEYQGGTRVQLMALVPLQNGDAKYDLVTLSTDVPEAFQALKGKYVRVPVGAYPMKGGSVGFFCLKGQKPEALSGVTA
jgi:hypothetical protein